jgi:GntR family transcriptional regulator, arabinose operon transcriptional repressor
VNITIDKTKIVPIYMQIKESMLSYIKQNNLSAGAALPNVKTVATSAGVSTRTADQAYKALIDDGICYRRPKKGTFIAGKNEVPAKKICGLLSTLHASEMNQNVLLSELYTGISEATGNYETDTSMLFGDTEYSINLYDASPCFNFLGIMAIAPSRLEETIQLAQKFPEKKFIIINYMFGQIADTPDNVYAVVNDDFGGAYKMVEHYVAKGAKTAIAINLQLGHHDETYNERFKGFSQAIRDYGLNGENTKDITLSMGTKMTHEGFVNLAYLEFKKYLSRNPKPNIVFVVNDMLAEGVEKCIEDEGLTGEIRVTGYDCLLKEFSVERNFDSVRVNYAEMGRMGMELLNSEEKEIPKVIKIAPELVIKN